MNTTKITIKKNWRWYLFGTWDRGFSFISFFMGAISLGITIFTWNFPDQIPSLIITRDLLVFFGLLIVSGVILSKYIYRESALVRALEKNQDSNNLLYCQYQNFHDTNHKFRNELFCHFNNSIPDTIMVTPAHKKLFESICHSTTTEVRNSFERFFKSKGYDLGEDISVSIKLTVTSKNLIDLLGHRLNSNEKKSLKKKKMWVFTIFRDPKTYEANREKREVATSIYDIEKNSAFINIIKEKSCKFSSDNLAALGDAYLNENHKWKEQYNSTMVVPIRYFSEKDDHYKYFGLLAVDSKNIEGLNLYENNESKFLLGHAADLLANYFLCIALDSSNYETQVGGTA